MTNNDFIYWLEGFFEISEATSLSLKQVNIIKEHLKLTKSRSQNLEGFTLWLDGFLTAIETENTNLSLQSVFKIKEELSKQIKNVMDKDLFVPSKLADLLKQGILDKSPVIC